MATQTVTDIDNGSLELERCEKVQRLLTFAGAATAKKGTILAVDSSSLKFVLFVKGGSSNENGIPKAVLPYEVVADGAQDIMVSAIVRGVVDKTRCVIHADGDDSNIDAKVIDQLRDYGVTPLDVQETSGAIFTDEDS